MSRESLRAKVLIIGSLLLVIHASAGELRVAAWNVTNYSSGRVAAFQTAIYGEFEGRSMSPDLILGQEFISAAGVNAFLQILNTAPDSPGDWAAADFVDGPDTDSAFFYRTSKLALATDLSPNGVTVVAVGGTSPNHPRNIMRYDVVVDAGGSAECRIALYSTHMKSGTTSDDQARRLLEAQRVRDDAEALPAGWHFIIGGDFNIQSSTQTAYQELVGSQTNNDGRFFDPIDTPGTWNNNSAFHFVHTQDPIGAGGMDDRHDQLLVSEGLIDGAGVDYIGDASIPYSTTTWNDPNHSYRSWGNDGTSYNTTLTTTGNTMVGATIAQALIASASSAGHLPVFLDLYIPDCPADLTGDGQIGIADLAQLLSHYSTPSGATPTDGDLDGDGDVDIADLAALLAVYGTTCGAV